MDIDGCDARELQQLVGRYGHLIDARDFQSLDEVFTSNAVFDASDFGRPVCSGVGSLAAMMAEAEHPLAHHSTNLVLEERDDGCVRLHSKGLAVLRNGRVLSLIYDDLAVRTPDGWRLSYRKAVLLRP